MGDMSSKYAGPDYSDIAESMASGMAAPMGKSFGKQLYQVGKKAKAVMDARIGKNQSFYGGPGSKGYVPPGRKAKMADKAPKINLRKEYKD
jgi:hypothetical protein